MKVALVLLLAWPVATMSSQRNAAGAPGQHSTLLSRRVPRRGLAAFIARATELRKPAAVGLPPPGPPTYPPPWYRQPAPTYSPCKYSVCDVGITHPYPAGLAPPPPSPAQLDSPGVTADDFQHGEIQ